MSDLAETSSTRASNFRAALVSGDLSLPVELGITARAIHIERGERECYTMALATIGEHVGPAARIIDCGAFAGLALGGLLDALERPKAGIVMTTALDERQFSRLQEKASTAQISHINYDATQSDWPLEEIGAGKTLVVVSGGGFGLLPLPNAFGLLESASQSLAQSDLIAVTLEMVRDGATIDAHYSEFGSHHAIHTLNTLGRHEGLQPRAFFDPAKMRVRFGAVAIQNASISWNGTRCTFREGAWLDMGGMTLHSPLTIPALHPDFAVADQWISQEGVVALVLLRKI